MQAELPKYDNPPVDQRIRALVCADEKGEVQVVAPELALVDPEPIRQATARELNSLPPSSDTPTCAIPGYYEMPSVVHASLKFKETLALATERPGEYVRASGSEIERLCQGHVSFEASFCEELKTTPTTTQQDAYKILEAVDRFTSRRIQERLDETLHIPPLPETARRIIELQREEDFDLKDLVQIVETDASIAARILGWSNSALYASPNPAKTLDDAIMRVLGFDIVFNMALGLAIGQSLSLPKSHVAGVTPYWLDAVYSAATMEALAHQIPQAQRPNPGTCYLAGLLSNFGTLVVGHVFPPQYETICRIQEANPLLSHTHVDLHVLSLNREVIASTLLELWELPDEVVTPIRYQFVSDYAGDHKPYVDLLRFTKRLLAHYQIGNEDDRENYADLAATAQSMGIEEDGLEEVVQSLTASTQDLGELAGNLGPHR